MITGFADDDDFGDGGLEIVEIDGLWETVGMTFSSMDVDNGDTIGEVEKELERDTDNGGKKWCSCTGNNLSSDGRLRFGGVGGEYILRGEFDPTELADEQEDSIEKALCCLPLK